MDFAEIAHVGSVLLHGVEWILAAMGVAVIAVGGIQSGLRFFIDWVRKRRNPDGVDFNMIRRELGLSIALGLEFILASDVILTIMMPDYYNLGILGALALIRTALTYFLNKELEQLQSRA